MKKVIWDFGTGKTLGRDSGNSPKPNKIFNMKKSMLNPLKNRGKTDMYFEYVFLLINIINIHISGKRCVEELSVEVVESQHGKVVDYMSKKHLREYPRQTDVNVKNVDSVQLYE